MKKETKSSRMKFFGIPKVFPYVKQHTGKMLVMLIFGLIVSFGDILIPVYQKYALDHFVKFKTLDTLPTFILLYAAVIVLSGLLNYISCWMAMRTEAYVNRDLRNIAFDHIQKLSLSFFNRNSVGRIHSRVISDISRLGEIFSWGIMDVFWNGSYVVGAVIVMFIMNPKLTLAVITIIPVIVLLFVIFQRNLIKVNRKVRETNSKIVGDFNEGITGAKTIKTLVIEDKVARSFYRHTSEIKKEKIKSAHIRGLFSGTVDLASSLALAIVLWKGGIIALSEVGTFSVFMSYAQGMIEPIRYFIESISELITSQVNIERFTDLINTEPDVKDSDRVIEKYGDSFNPKKENWEKIKGDIEFRDVTFRYPDGDENVLEHFNLEIPFGTNVAIVGETGAGKSTLVNLICRFFEPTGGKILIDGRDIRERSQLWLHSSIGYVLQTPHLFSGTVRENLLYGNPGATEQEIQCALKLVAADTVVGKLEKGLESDVGESGDLLSAGEKQLISFARAVIADPRILILDEATASVDTITEQKIQNAMDSVIKDRTSVVIAHRLSTVKNADVILVVRDGRIVEQGTHSELLANHGYYYDLYTMQYEDEATSAFFD